MNSAVKTSRRKALSSRRLFIGRDADLLPQGRLPGPVPWVIAIMVALTAIALATGLALGNAVTSAKAEIEGGVTVQVVEPRSELREQEARRALTALQANPDVENTRLVPQKELDALVAPWLGSATGSEVSTAIPVPALIDVRLKSEATSERVEAIQRSVMKVAPSARVDAQSTWLKPVFDAIASLQWLAVALVVLLAVALAAAVLLAARTALGSSRETIEIVHLLGGTDAQIARVFQRSIGWDAAAGGGLGLAFAVVVIMTLGHRFASLGAGLVSSGALIWSDWLVLALVPIWATVLAMMTARLTVMHALRKML